MLAELLDSAFRYNNPFSSVTEKLRVPDSSITVDDARELIDSGEPHAVQLGITFLGRILARSSAEESLILDAIPSLERIARVRLRRGDAPIELEIQERAAQLLYSIPEPSPQLVAFLRSTEMRAIEGRRLLNDKGEIRRFDPSRDQFQLVQLEVIRDGITSGLDNLRVDDVLAVLMNPRDVGTDKLKGLLPNEAACCVWVLRALEENEWLRRYCGSQMAMLSDTLDDFFRMDDPQYIDGQAKRLQSLARTFHPKNAPTERGELTEWMRKASEALQDVLPKVFNGLRTAVFFASKSDAPFGLNDLLGPETVVAPPKPREDHILDAVLASAKIAEAAVEGGTDPETAFTLGQVGLLASLRRDGIQIEGKAVFPQLGAPPPLQIAPPDTEEEGADQEGAGTE